MHRILRTAIPGLLLVPLACAAPVLQPAAPTAGPDLSAYASCAREALRRAYIGIGNERWQETRQVRLPDYPPLQAFPRLVAPALVEARRCGGDARWYVPVIYRLDSEVVRPGLVPPGEAPKSFDMSPFLSFWLERTHASSHVPADLIGLNALPAEKITEQELPDLELPPKILEAGFRFDDLQGVVLAVPLDFIEIRERKCSDGEHCPDSEYFWLRILPRDPRQLTSTGLARAVREGDLRGVAQASALDGSPDVDVSELDDIRAYFQCSRKLGRYTCPHPFKHFWSRSYDVGEAAANLAEALGEGGEDHIRDGRVALRAALRGLYGADQSPAGVLLSRAASGEPRTVRFLVVADMQRRPLHSKFHRFLHLVDPKYPFTPRHAQPEGVDEHVASTVAGDQLRRIRKKVRGVEFVLFAGDLSDAQVGSNIPALALNVFGLSPPRSFYEKESPMLLRTLRHFGLPFIAVPGNHDGMVGYPGILNVTGFGFLRGLDRINDWVPVLLKAPNPAFSLGWSDARYDGLAEWRYSFGPLSYAFQYANQTFAGLNSFNLRQSERSAVGGIALNWGGGVKLEDTRWLDAALSTLAGAGDSRQILFMHQDPRGATPVVEGVETRIDRYGIYDDTEVFFSFFTLGHFGLGHSPFWDMWLPVVTPAAHHISRLAVDYARGTARPQEEWMKRSFDPPGFDSSGDAYHARALIGVIDDKLYRDGQGGISNIFFGHDNVLLDEAWVQGESSAVFPQLPDARWTGSEYHGGWAAIRHGFKIRNDEPPEWAKALWELPGQASVTRLKDVTHSNENAMTLVTIRCHAGQCVEPEVETLWIPREP